MARIKNLSHNNLQEKSIERAKKYLTEQNYVDAKDEIEKVLDVNPMDDRALNLLAIIMLKLDQYNKAVKIYEELVTRYRKTMPLRINLGVAYLKNNQAENAVKEFTVVLDNDSTNKTVLKLYGKALLKLNRVDEAIKIFRKAGMNDYVKKIRKHGADAPGVSELSNDDVAHEPLKEEKPADVRKVKKQQDTAAEQAEVEEEPLKPESEEAEVKEEKPADVRKVEDRQDTAAEQAEVEEEPLKPESEEMQTDEQDGRSGQQMTMEAEEDKAEIEESLPEGEKVTDKEEQEREVTESDSGSVQTEESETSDESEETAAAEKEEKEVSDESAEQLQKMIKGIPALVRETSLSEFDAKVNYINDSMMLFNMDGNLMYVRNKGIITLSESLTIEQAYKRYRGKDTKSIFADKKDDPIVLVYGKGELILKCDFEKVKLFNLKNESMFLNDERLVVFQGDLEWENGRVELQVGKSINVTQIRGTADIFLGLHGNAISLNVNAENPVTVCLGSLLGWYGKIIPKTSEIQQYTSKQYISFHGEGAVFIDA